MLLDCEVAACPDDVGEVDEVIAAETVEGYFGLFAFMAVVEGDDGAGGFVGGGEGGCGMGFDGDIEVVVPAVDLEHLGMGGLAGDEDLGHFSGSWKLDWWMMKGRCTVGGMQDSKSNTVAKMFKKN